MLGRQRERAVLDRVVAEARDGHGGVLVVYGEPGVGKTALLDYAIEAGADFRVARAVGVGGEMELAFAALQQLCSPSLDLMDRLPDPQRDAFQVALGLSAGRPPNPFLVGLAVLSLLSEAAEEQPLLCVVDDAQWLDRASGRVLAFVARRLLAEKIAMVFAARESSARSPASPELHVEPLGRRDARALLDSVLPARLDERVLERIVVETHGNPLALLELPRGVDACAARGWVRPARGAASLRSDRGKLRAPARTAAARRAASAPRGRGRSDRRRRARVAGCPTVSASRSRPRTPPSRMACWTFDAGVAFRHPLVRSAVYRAAGT